MVYNEVVIALAKLENLKASHNTMRRGRGETTLLSL